MDMHRTHANVKHMRMASLRPAEISLRLAGTNASHDDSVAEKTLKECTHSSKASGARPAGLLAQPHGITQQPGGKKVPSVDVSICEILRIPPQILGGYCRGQPQGSPKKSGETIFFHKKLKRKQIRDPKSRINVIATPVAPTAHLNTRPSHPLEQGPPRSRASRPLG
jgi:hypothetical protein